MKVRGSTLLLAIMLILPSAAGFGQEQYPNKGIQESGNGVKKNSPSLFEGLTDVIQAQKEKYQKDIQDQIQNNVKSFQDKFNSLKSLAGKTEPEKPAKQENPLTPAYAGNEGSEKKPAQTVGVNANSGSGFWAKLNAVQETTMAFLTQLMTILFK